jgi:plasmid stabilization system protein ParE
VKRPVTWARAALDDIKEQIAFIAQDNPTAALGDMATGRPGRVTGSYEKSVSRLPYIIAYELRPIAGRESVVILRVIHTSRDWPDEDWPH